jgi:hypothetical protein
MTYPATRRFFRDDEFRNENAAIAGVVRALAQGQNYRYASDLKVTPSDAKVFGETGWAWASSTLEWSPVRNFGSGVGYYSAANIAEVTLSDPRAPATAVRLHAYITRPASGATVGDLVVTNRTTGEVTTVAIPDAAAGWNISATIPAEPGDVLRISATYTSGVTFIIGGICMYWDSIGLSLPGAVFNAGWSARSQAWAADNRPLSTAVLKWLGRMTNASVRDRPMMIAASWLYNPAAGVGAGYSTVPTVVGRYLIPVGGRTPSLTVRVRYRSSGACTITAALSGGDSGTITIGGAGTSVASTTITFASVPAALYQQELTLTVNGSPTYCDVQWVGVWENHSTATSLALPGGETVPANFDPNLDERMGSGSAIRSDDIARLVANEVWLWAYRRDRVLVNDCRFTYLEAGSGLTFTGAGGLTDRSALHELRTSKVNAGDAFGELKVRAGWYQGSGTGRPTPWEAWRFQVGVNSLADYAGSPAVGCEVQSYDYPDANWASFEQSSWQHARGGSLAGDTTYLLETVLLTAGHTSSIGKTTRPSWLTIEELPLNSPARTYP